mmetsp:Transcript_3527/g.2114  ORF Transcript_3527/g.2114 Transcript_3527/m.2114 type:complete len:312 (-) Transcript_3527:1516-2451(-)
MKKKTIFLLLIIVTFCMLIASCFPKVNLFNINAQRSEAVNKNFKKSIAVAILDSAVNEPTKQFVPKLRYLFFENMEKLCPNIILLREKNTDIIKKFAELPKLPSGQLDNRFLVKAGRQLGVNAIAFVYLDNFKKNLKKKRTWLKDNYNSILFQIKVEIHDTETGAKLLDKVFSTKIKLNEKEENFHKTKDISLTNISNPTEINEKFEDIIHNMAEKICSIINSQTWKGYITKTYNKNVIISTGKNAGLKPGDILDVYGSNSTIEGAFGQLFFMPGSKIGQLKLTSVNLKHSGAVIISGKEIKVGNCVKNGD